MTTKSDLLGEIENKILVGDGCWKWTGRLSKRGHGFVNVPGERRALLAHRVVWELMVGPISYGRRLRSSCLDSSCVRPAHRYLIDPKPTDRPECRVDGCTDPAHLMSETLCRKHRDKFRRYGDPLLGIASPGTGHVNKAGYRDIYVDGRQVLQHRHVMEVVLGRPLLRCENVHHINGARLDNRPENLELWSSSQPSGQRVADKVAWAREILDLYGSDVSSWRNR